MTPLKINILVILKFLVCENVESLLYLAPKSAKITNFNYLRTSYFFW
jgi:hypothetical protein